MKKLRLSLFLSLFILLSLKAFCSGKSVERIERNTNKKITAAATAPENKISLQHLLDQFPAGSPERAAAATLLGPRFETGRRSILGNPKYGFIFPIYPEEFFDLISFIRERNGGDGIKILGLATADGVNELLLSLFTKGVHAETHICDIASKEIAECRKHLAAPTFPESHKSKIQTHCCDMYDLKIKLAHLQGQFDIICAQNIFHFISPRDHAKFFDLVRFFLKENGKLVLGVQSIVTKTKDRYSTIFGMVNLCTICREESTEHKKDALISSSELKPCPLKLSKLEIDNIDVLALDRTIYMEISDNGTMSLVNEHFLDSLCDHRIKDEALNFLSDSPSFWQKGEHLIVLIQKIQSFFAESLLNILHANDFWCDSISYCNGITGHRMKRFDGPRMLSVICSKSRVAEIYEENFKASTKIQALIRGKLTRNKLKAK
jgi:hypothetical protein